MKCNNLVKYTESPKTKKRNSKSQEFSQELTRKMREELERQAAEDKETLVHNEAIRSILSRGYKINPAYEDGKVSLINSDGVPTKIYKNVFRALADILAKET